jgi:hypothetical protein
MISIFSDFTPLGSVQHAPVSLSTVHHSPQRFRRFTIAAAWFARITSTLCLSFL